MLDQVDAPLDEASMARYVEAVRGMANRSQFILISDARRTIEWVDVLYGVAMGEPGVSRLVSVRVNEGAKQRSIDRGQNAPPGAMQAA